MAHRRGARIVGSVKRRSVWIAPALQAYVSVATATKVIISSFNPEASGIHFPTVVRTRGQVAIKATSAAVDNTSVGAYGVGVVSEDAFAAGVGSIPGPFSDADWPGWFVWRSFTYRFEFSDATGALLMNMVQEVDSKAMRKVGLNEVIVTVAESFIGAFDVSMPLRKLLKLS